MFKNSVILSIKIIILVISYYILDYLFTTEVIMIIAAALIAIYIAYNIKFKGNPDARLEILCDAKMYLERVNSKYSKRNQDVYNTRLAYAYTYIGDYTLAESHIVKANKDSLVKKPKETMIYYLVLLRLAFEEEDLEKFKTILNEYKNLETKKYIGMDIEVMAVPMYIMEKKYKNLIDKLVTLIPEQKKRYLIIELEYYLALAYVKTNSLEDAKAVLEFVTSKDFELIYVEKCKDLLKSI